MSIIGGFTSSIEVWIAAFTGIFIIILTLYAIEARNATKEISKEMEKWLKDIKFNDWLKEKNGKKKEE